MMQPNITHMPCDLNQQQKRHDARKDSLARAVAWRMGKRSWRTSSSVATFSTGCSAEEGRGSSSRPRTSGPARPKTRSTVSGSRPSASAPVPAAEDQRDRMSARIGGQSTRYSP